MKQKFIVGDIVMYDNKIMVIKEPRDGICFDLYCPKERLKYCYVDVESIKPVTLTSAFLEKNKWYLREHHEREFFEDVSWDSYYNPAISRIGLRFYPEEEAFFPYLYREDISEKPIRYVHQFQHLLFGLGINHEMEV